LSSFVGNNFFVDKSTDIVAETVADDCRNTFDGRVGGTGTSAATTTTLCGAIDDGDGDLAEAAVVIVRPFDFAHVG
jgi:hypothetical protein